MKKTTNKYKLILTIEDRQTSFKKRDWSISNWRDK